MRHRTYTAIVAATFATFLFASYGMAQPRFGFHLEFGDRGRPVNEFYVTMGNYYHVPYEEVCAVHDVGISDDDIPVVLFIHANSQYSVRHIANLRARGASWVQISTWCGVPPTVYGYSERPYRRGPPYGNAYGYWKHGPGRWRNDYYPSDDVISNYAHRPFRHHDRDDNRYERHRDDD